jgi:hypothetical protein
MKLRRMKRPLSQTAAYPHSLASFCAGYSALKLIFTYLNVEDLIVARNVCKVWKELANEPILWTKLRIANSQLTDVLANNLCKHKTEHLIVIKEDNDDWEGFIKAVPKIKTLRILELCPCPAVVLEETVKKCPQIEILKAPSIKSERLNVEDIKSLTNSTNLQLRAVTKMTLENDLTCLSELVKLTHLVMFSYEFLQLL